jgi:GNAT superfamily N-acetyltransferase
MKLPASPGENIFVVVALESMMLQSLQVRRGTAEDATAVSTVLLEAFREYQSQYTPDGFAATTPDEFSVIERLTEGPIWVAELDNQVIGTASAVLHESRGLYVRGMAVLPEGRGLGVGAVLLDAIESFAKESDCHRLYLRTTPFLHRAIRLYTNLGFEFIEDGSQELFGTPLLTMEKVL